MRDLTRGNKADVFWHLIKDKNRLGVFFFLLPPLGFSLCWGRGRSCHRGDSFSASKKVFKSVYVTSRFEDLQREAGAPNLGLLQTLIGNASFSLGPPERRSGPHATQHSGHNLFF